MKTMAGCLTRIISSRYGHAFTSLVALSCFFLGVFIAPMINSVPITCVPSESGQQRVEAQLTNANINRERDIPPLTDHLRFRSDCSQAIPATDIRRFLLDSLYDGVSPFQGFPPDFAKPWLSKSSISGWGSQAPVFERLVREVKPAVVLELGSFLGASATHMVNLTSVIMGQPSLILCVDDFRGWPGFRYTFKQLHQPHGDVQLLYQFIQNVVSLNMTESILPLAFATTSAMDALCGWGIYADLVEVDAGHDFHSAWADINLAYNLVRPGGVMFGHDYYNSVDNRGVGRAVDLFAKVKGLWVEPDGEHWILRGDYSGRAMHG